MTVQFSRVCPIPTYTQRDITSDRASEDEVFVKIIKPHSTNLSLHLTVIVTRHLQETLNNCSTPKTPQTMLPHILPFISLIFATPIYSIPLTPRQPTPEPFTYLNLTAGDIHTSLSSLPSDRCAVLFSDGYLIFPNAVLNATDPNLNILHCQKELLFNLVPSRLQFSILAAKFDGQLSLKGGYFVEEVGMSVHYVQVRTTPTLYIGEED